MAVQTVFRACDWAFAAGSLGTFVPPASKKLGSVPRAVASEEH